MERRIRMPEGAANLLYEKMEAMATSRAALMVRLPPEVTEEEAREYYDGAFNRFVLAGVDFRRYELSLMQSLGVTSYIRTEGTDMIVGEE